MASHLTLLGVVLCSLVVSTSEIPPQADFDLQAARVIDNPEKHYTRQNENGLSHYPMGILDLSYTSVYNGTCRKMEKVANKTDVPGKFRHISQKFSLFQLYSFGHLSELLIVDVKYDEYTLTYSINTKGNETYFVNKLDGRSVDLSADVQEKFRQFSLQTDFLPENIFILPKSDTV
ncbi:unnamed protein product [Oreochromis niloticus]|nr:unnamed protein product [Mustela putorius furo]